MYCKSLSKTWLYAWYDGQTFINGGTVRCLTVELIVQHFFNVSWMSKFNIEDVAYY